MMNEEAVDNKETTENQHVENENPTPNASNENAEGVNDGADSTEGNVDSLDEMEQLKVELAEMKNKYVRLHAEFDNFRKRNARERVELIKNASQSVLSEMLPVLDDFDRAAKANEDNDDIKAVKEGFHLIHNKMFKVLEANGLKPMDAMGKAFDTDVHEAITQIPAPSKKMRGKVVDVIEKGYMLNDSVLRYAKVVVGQ